MKLFMDTKVNYTIGLPIKNNNKEMFVVVINSLTKLYSDKLVFSNINYDFDDQRILLTGPNGVGKSTLLAIIAGLESFQEGLVKLHGQPIPQEGLQNFVAIASDKLIFPEFLSAQQVLSLTSKYRDCSNQQGLVARFSFETFLKTSVANLSSGNLKKLQLINAFIRNAHVLILDEPTAALEAKSHAALFELIDEFDGQVIVTSHEPTPFLAQNFVEYRL